MATLSEMRDHLLWSGQLSQKESEHTEPAEMESRYDKYLLSSGGYHALQRTFSEVECVVLTNSRNPTILVFLLHGYGANHYDLVELGEIFFPKHGSEVKVAFVFPRGIIEMKKNEFGRVESEYGSFKWWSIFNMSSWKSFFAENGLIRGVRDPYIDVPEGLSMAREKVIACMDQAESALGIDRHNVALAGFSQGSMLALDLFFHRDCPPLGLALWSSASMCKQLWRDTLRRMSSEHIKHLKDVPIFISHGSLDYIVPVPLTKVLQNFLTDEGFTFAYKQFRGSHEIPNEVAEEFYEILIGCYRLRGLNLEGQLKIDDGLRTFLRPGTKFAEPKTYWCCKSCR